ncbi:hypothetical protein ACH42_08280 [Endozoicomonas sp. (ex Bugula neritina AB1)]|nr:hypothetical protein ACH42_08280 [Endozoicomonas sp. (ex Bugula neritina AB1)]
MVRSNRSRVKPGYSLRELHDQAMADLALLPQKPIHLKYQGYCNDGYWVCVYHWNHVKGVIVGSDPPNDSWPKSNR